MVEVSVYLDKEWFESHKAHFLKQANENIDAKDKTYQITIKNMELQDADFSEEIPYLFFDTKGAAMSVSVNLPSDPDLLSGMVGFIVKRLNKAKALFETLG